MTQEITQLSLTFANPLLFRQKGCGPYLGRDARGWVQAQPVLPASDGHLPGGAGKPSSAGGLRPGGCSGGSAGAEGGSWLPGAGGCG